MNRAEAQAKNTTQCLIALTLLISGCAKPAPVVTVAPSRTATPALELPSGHFIAAEIDRVTKLAGLSPLKMASVAPTDMEVRVWYGFGLIALEGFVIKRTNNRWAAFHLKADYIKHVALVPLSAPKSGWEQCWERLTNSEVLTLSGGTEPPDPDAQGFYVETMTGGSYRNYLYNSPEYSDSPTAKRMLAIGDIISDEFGLKRFHVTKPLQSMAMPNSNRLSGLAVE